MKWMEQGWDSGCERYIRQLIGKVIIYTSVRCTSMIYTSGTYKGSICIDFQFERSCIFSSFNFLCFFAFFEFAV